MQQKQSISDDKQSTTDRRTVTNTGLVKVAVQFSASTFMMKITTFEKPEIVMTAAMGIWLGWIRCRKFAIRSYPPNPTKEWGYRKSQGWD